MSLFRVCFTFLSLCYDITTATTKYLFQNTNTYNISNKHTDKWNENKKNTPYKALKLQDASFVFISTLFLKSFVLLYDWDFSIHLAFCLAISNIVWYAYFTLIFCFFFSFKLNGCKRLKNSIQLTEIVSVISFSSLSLSSWFWTICSNLECC